jgi:predicted ABC-class ATPase
MNSAATLMTSHNTERLIAVGDRRAILTMNSAITLMTSRTTEGLIAFVGNGAILPRKTGASDLPMDAAAAVPFQSPQSMQVSITVPHGGVRSAFFDGILRSRRDIEFHAFAPVEVLPCV